MAGKGNRKTPYLFIAPFLVMFAAFKLYPMVYGFAGGCTIFCVNGKRET